VISPIGRESRIFRDFRGLSRGSEFGSLICGTRGRTRTGTLLRAGDFESPVSTNFTTLAGLTM